MEQKELLWALRHLRVQTGSLACVGCGYAHNCGIHGCAILNAVVEELERMSGREEEATCR